MQNQTVGDAITDLLCIESCLAYLKWTAKDWLAIYTDYKCVNMKVVVKDKAKMKLNFVEDVIYEPKELQDLINALMQKNPKARCFARPSGTEDIVRIYVEHPEMEVAKKIAAEIGQAFKENKVLNEWGGW